MTTPHTGTTSAELLSALVDGEPRGDDLDLALSACRDDDGLLERWSAYHLIGDALRFPTVSVQLAGAGFRQRFAQRLALEPDFAVEPPELSRLLTMPISALPVGARHASAANDYSFRWKLLAGVASLTAASAISWSLFSAVNVEPLQLTVAPSSEQILIATPQGPLMRDARLHEWMEAHRQLGSAPTQMPSGFLRSATFETPQGSAGR